MDLGQELARCCAVATSTWSDVLDRLGLSGVCHGLMLQSGRGAIAGTAVTVKERVGPFRSDAPPFAVGTVLDSTYRGSILIVDMGGAEVSTFGGLAAEAAVQRGVAGVAIDGGCRDIEAIRAAGLWVRSRHVTPVSGTGRAIVEDINVPVTIGGTTIHPGDCVIGDETGLVCVPRDRLLQALMIAEELTTRDVAFSTALKRGETFAAISSRLQHQ